MGSNSLLAHRGCKENAAIMQQTNRECQYLIVRQRLPGCVKQTMGNAVALELAGENVPFHPRDGPPSLDPPQWVPTTSILHSQYCTP